MIGNQDKALSAEKDLVEIAIDYVWREQSAKEIADTRLLQRLTADPGVGIADDQWA